MAVFEEKEKPKISETITKKHEIPSGLWVKCKQCGEIIYSKELCANAKVCAKCDYHFTMTAAERVAMLADAGARFGVNYLITPYRLADLEPVVLRLVALGCRDVLLLSYNGSDADLHLDAAQSRDLANRTNLLSRALVGRATLKLDVCWGERLDAVPRLFNRADCGAGRDFVVLTSDRQLMPCSFHHVKVPVRSAVNVLETWQRRRDDLASPSRIPGCARAPGYGLNRLQVIA